MHFTAIECAGRDAAVVHFAAMRWGGLGCGQHYVGVLLDAKNEVTEPNVYSGGGKSNLGSATVDIRATDLVASSLSPTGKWTAGKTGSAMLTWMNKLKLPASTYGSFSLILMLSTSSNFKSGQQYQLWKKTTTQSTGTTKAMFKIKTPKFYGSKKTFWLHFIVDSTSKIPELTSSNNVKTSSVVVYAP